MNMLCDIIDQLRQNPNIVTRKLVRQKLTIPRNRHTPCIITEMQIAPRTITVGPKDLAAVLGAATEGAIPDGDWAGEVSRGGRVIPAGRRFDLVFGAIRNDKTIVITDPKYQALASIKVPLSHLSPGPLYARLIVKSFPNEELLEEERDAKI